MSETPMTPELRAQVAEMIGDAKPATGRLLEQLAASVRDRREHEHPTWEDLFCLNLVSFMGERMGPVLRRLLDAEARAERYRIAWRMARTRAIATGGAADRYATRSRDAQEALQHMLFAVIAGQLALHEANRERQELRARVAELEAERHVTNEALDDAVRALRGDGIMRLNAPTQALRDDEPAALRVEDTADILTLADAQHADATYNPASHTISLELTATPEQWAAWQEALSVDLARTTNRGSFVTSHAAWRGVHVVIRCWFSRPGGVS